MIRNQPRPANRARRFLIAIPALVALFALAAGNSLAADSDNDGWDDAEDNCPYNWNPFQGDYDGDGAGNPCDCASNVVGVSQEPGQLGGTLRMDKTGGTRLSWMRAVQGHVSQVYRGTFVVGQPWSYNESCFENGDGDTEAVDAEVPPPGTGFYYLVTGANICGEGPAGMDSTGVAIEPSSRCNERVDDDDADSVDNYRDNCPLDDNAGQNDGDQDFVGNVCDNCPSTPNSTQSDLDGDGIGDACETCPNDPDDDIDSDGFCADEDNCPLTPNPGQADMDSDGTGDLCDPCPADDLDDADLDGFCADVDNCAWIHNPDQFDDDSDGVGNLCDICPDDFDPAQTDTDSDGLGDGCDLCPSDPLNDGDGDGHCAGADNCPTISNPGQEDADSDGTGDACETVPGLVYINEVHYDQDTGEQEFVEIYVTEGPVDLTGWRVGDQDTVTLVFDASDPRFACAEPFVVDTGDRVVVYQGAGSSVCVGQVRELYLDVDLFLKRDGDDVLLQDAGMACRDYVAFESGLDVDPAPADCPWFGQPTDNGAATGVSISRFDLAPLTDTDSASDWEPSGETVTVGPSSPGTANQVGPADQDSDGVPDAGDNCPATPNPGQSDLDSDGLGDLCDPCPTDPGGDADSDGVCDVVDNCPDVTNADQTDSDSDGLGDLCDVCPTEYDPAQTDSDSDGLGDPCDPCPLDPLDDVDSDGICADQDNCPTFPNPLQTDTDSDGIGDECETLPGLVYVNEVNYDQGTGAQEFIELFVVEGPVDLTSWSVTDQDTETVVFDSTDSRFPCPEPFIVEAGDRIVIWQGTGTSVCQGPIREIFIGTGTFLAREGDDVVLRDAGSACRDFVAFEYGSGVDAAPQDCNWGGLHPSNDDEPGTSISRFDSLPFVDTDDGNDWEKSGATNTVGPMTPGLPNEAGPADQDSDGVSDIGDNCPDIYNPVQADSDTDGEGDLCDVCPSDPGNDDDSDGVCAASDNCPTIYNPGQADSDSNGTGDACQGVPVIVEIPVVEQDIRSSTPLIAQHRQQPSSRVGKRGTSIYRSLGRSDLSSIPAGAVITGATLVYYTSSGDPLNIDQNGDTGPSDGPIIVEVHELLKAWNYDEPLTYPADHTDNEELVDTGETTWDFSLYPDTWASPGASGATDSGPPLATTTIWSALDDLVEINGTAFIDLVTAWHADPATNHGFMIKATDADEQASFDNRKVFCGKGFPLETSTGLNQAEAESHRPLIRIEYRVP